MRGADHRKAHPDRRAGVVVILDLGFRQGGLFHRRPHHRAQAAIQRAVQQELADFPGDGGFRRRVHGGVAVAPGALHAQAAELAGLHAHPVVGVGAAFGAEIQDRDRLLGRVPLLGAMVFLDLPLDRQAVAVPAGDVVGVIAGHLAGTVDHVLVDLVQRRADMDVAVRIRRPIVQDEQRSPGGGRADLAPQVHGVPARQDLRLLLRQVAAHRKAGPRQENRVAVIGKLVGDGVVHAGSVRQGAGAGARLYNMWTGQVAVSRLRRLYTDATGATMLNAER